jgi:hypothetical protein
MIKPNSLVLALAMVYLVLGTGAEAVTAGPYNITVDLPGFNAISIVGPMDTNLVGMTAVSYMVGIAEGNSTTPSAGAHRMTVEIMKFNLPFDIGDKDFMTKAYDGTAKNIYPGIGWDLKDQVMIEGRLAAHKQNLTEGIDFISYFANPNMKITLGMRNLTSEEFTNVLRTFRVTK